MKQKKRWLCGSLLFVVTVAAGFARTGDAAEAKGSSANSANSEAAAAADPGPTPTPTPAPSPTLSVGNQNVAALLNVLVNKSVLTPAEASEIRNAAPDAEFQLLVQALSRKGVLTAADLSTAAPPAAPAAAPAVVADAARETDAASVSSPEPEPAPQAGHATPAIQGTQPPPPPGVVAAITPIRVLPVDPPKRDGLVPAFKMGGVKMTPYGFIKATAVHDSSSPNGDDFPFVGLFLTSTSVLSTGPTQDPEFHLKARSTRIGANFEWPDSSPRLTFTGKIEGDYEGNFSEVDNRDVSSIRSNSFQLRQAWGRMDYAASDKTDLYFEAGQDWSLFASSVLPNILETTFLGAYYGTIYERSPQFQFGAVQTLGGSRNFKISPTFAIMMPSTGEIEKLAGTLAGFEGQIGQGEREGADSGRPELEARLALQFQLDKAPSVAPAQVLWAGFQSRRTSIVPSSAYTTTATYCAANPIICQEQAAFPNGFTASSTQYGNQVAVSLPTRWATLVASGYFGGDLRFFFGGQVNTYYTDTTGLTNPTTFTPLDGALGAAGAQTLAINSSGNVVVAPEKPIRGFGGFINLGLPLSRWFNADPKGHNAGWQLYFHAGKDQVVHRDLVASGGQGGLPLLMGKVFAATLYYKVNPYVTFGVEQSVYGTRLQPGLDYSIAGSPDNLWQDHRTEFGPIFTF